MKRAVLFLMLIVTLGAVPVRAASAPPAPTPHRRPRISDLDRRAPLVERNAFVRGFYNLLPFGLAVFLGFHPGSVRVEGPSAVVRRDR